MFYQHRLASRHIKKSSRSTILMKLTSKALAGAAVASLIFIGFLKTAQADICALDPTLGNDGRIVTDFNDQSESVSAIVIQPDGKMIVAGNIISDNRFDFLVVRYNSDGSLDDGTANDSTPGDSFGTGGKAQTGFFEFNSHASSMALQPDGKLLVAGTAYTGYSSFKNQFAIARYNSDGSLDSSFGNDGKVTTSVSGHSDSIRRIFLKPDGKIMAVGSSLIPLDDTPYPPVSLYLSMARYNSDGSLDNGTVNDSTPGDSYGNGGVITYNSPSEGGINDVIIQPDGKVLTVGAGPSGDDLPDFFVARYNTDGSLDDGTVNDLRPGDSFGTGGIVHTTFTHSYDIPNAVALQPDGKIVVAGRVFYDNEGADMGMVRYHRDGSLDSSFGNGGKTLTDFNNREDGADVMIIQPDGKIILAGRSQDPGPYGDFGMFALSRYNLNGKLDQSFGQSGKLNTVLTLDISSVYALALQPDGKVVAAGSIFGDLTHDIGLARYATNDTCLPPPLALSLYSYSVPGSLATQGNVTLREPAPPGGTVVTLMSTNGAATVPASVTVPAGRFTKWFSIKTTPVAARQAGQIIAKVGALDKRVSFAVVPPGVASLSLKPNPTENLRRATGVVTLEAPAPEGGVIVQLASRNPGVASPVASSINIPAGTRVKSFTLRVADVDSQRTATITAKANGVSKSAILTVH